MHPAISDFPSLHFYDGKVSSGVRASDRPTPQGFPWPTKSGPVAFLRVNDNETGGCWGCGGNMSKLRGIVARLCDS